MSSLSYLSSYLFIAPHLPGKANLRPAEQRSPAHTAVKQAAAQEPLEPVMAQWHRSARADLLCSQYLFPAGIFLLWLLFLQTRSIFKSQLTECQVTFFWGASQAKFKWTRRNLTQYGLKRTVFSINMPEITPHPILIHGFPRMTKLVFSGVPSLQRCCSTSAMGAAPPGGRFRWLSTVLLS